ncbi:hypothetical protein AKJ65_04755 [candidate division MSBL1 archaeon SCGC-AAA259E19]|uniref:Zinc/iron-chelating domain-containing protein n=1 Tax=candidate division MSBL1 archaeon SCGC-AAA259E19 TaxID=1698264 RepID=A0A133UJD7_9EURY|nr:hypothetical protein AKJ65_04755 [candidate division MSBL1 archaeon SCGC-AAA259E19]
MWSRTRVKTPTGGEINPTDYLTIYSDGFGEMLWIDPQREERLDKCPFLYTGEDGKAQCIMHEHKTEDCRNWPFDQEGTLRLDCESICPEVRRLIEKHGETALKNWGVAKTSS